MFGWTKTRCPKLSAHDVAVWLANHATEQGASRLSKQVYFRAAVMLETEDAERRAFVDDVLGQ